MANFENANNGYTLRLTVNEDSYSIANNTSTISWALYLIATSYNYFSTWSFPASVTINGENVYSSSEYRSISQRGTLTIASGTKTITHNTDGTKTIACSASISATGAGYMPGNISVSGNLKLTDIPRKSTITALDANIESATTININRASSSFTHTITWSFSDLSGTIATKTSDTSLGWIIPSSFYEKIPNSSYATVTLTCTTYNGNTSLGNTTTTFTASVPTSGTNDSRPIISTVGVKTTATGKTLNSKRFVRYVTPIKLDFTGSCINYAGFDTLIESRNYSILPTTSTSGGITNLSVSNEIIYSKNIGRLYDGSPMTIVLTDSRGLTTTKVLSEENGDFTVVPYIFTTITANIERVSPTSDDIKMTFSGNFYNGFFDEGEYNENYLIIKWRYKEKDGDWIPTGSSPTSPVWRELREGTDFEYVNGENKYQSIGDITIQNLFDYQKEYVIEINVQDDIEEAISTVISIGRGIPYFDYGVDSNGNNYFNINGTLYINNQQVNI